MSTADLLRDQLTHALHALQFLAREDYEPVTQQAGSGKPVIEVRACPKCQQLRRRFGAEIIGVGHDERGRWQRWQAEINGCLVEWVEVVHV